MLENNEVYDKIQSSNHNTRIIGRGTKILLFGERIQNIIFLTWFWLIQKSYESHTIRGLYIGLKRIYYGWKEDKKWDKNMKEIFPK